MMPNMLDYERLVRQVADLNVELALLKGRHNKRDEEERRWDKIETSPEIGTMTEEKRLRRIIRGWEERYDILSEMYVKAVETGKAQEWNETKEARSLRLWKEQKRRAYWERKVQWIREAKKELKSIWALIRGLK